MYAQAIIPETVEALDFHMSVNKAVRLRVNAAITVSPSAAITVVWPLGLST
jgi:hypothetical protein